VDAPHPSQTPVGCQALAGRASITLTPAPERPCIQKTEPREFAHPNSDPLEIAFECLERS
jgi:hypothetical protein